MATYKQQVEGVTSLAIGTTPTNDELSQFLVDGTREVINRVISVRPDEIVKFTASTHDSNDSGIVAEGQLLSVVREHDSTSILRPCSVIDPRDRYEASDDTSLKYRSKYNPGFYLLNGKVHTVPASAGSDNDAIVTQVYYAVNTGHASTVIQNFPKEYEYLVVLYASCRSIHAVMGAKALPVEPVFEDLPEDVAESVIVFGTLVEKAASTVNTGDMTVGSTGSAPTYTSPSTALTAFSVTSAPPDAPTVPDFEITVTSSLPVMTVTSDYTPPSVSGIGTDLTETMSTGDSQVDFGDWWEKWGDFIEDNDDPEIAGAHGGKVGAFISAYQAAVANRLNVFNTSLQNNLNTFNAELQAYQAELQNLITEKQFESQAEHVAQLQQYQAEVTAYQAEVQAEIQDYGHRLARYSAEQQDSLQSFQSSSTLFQADLQKQIAEYQADVQIAIRNADHQAQQESEKKVRDMEALTQDYGLALQNYQAKIAKYQADSAASLQLYQAEVQATGVEYQWLQDQYSRLKAEYDSAFNALQIAAPAAEEAKA